MTITPLGDDVFQIDTEQSGYPGITAGYLIRTSKPCLVETGTASSSETVISALRQLGIQQKDLATIVVTHVHLDHAGGAGHLTSHFAKSQLIAHERGARHLVDPSRLMASARRVFGTLLDEVMGELLPTPIERVVSLGDVGKIDLGDGRFLDTFYAPGHASHHIGLVDTSSGDLYVGDAAGVYIQETKTQRPATPPPDFDLEITLKSIELFRSLAPKRLLFSHYGPVTEVDQTLDVSIEELRLWVELVKDARHEQLDLDHAIAMIKEKTHERYTRLFNDPALAHRFEELNSTGANIVGINRWLDKIEESEYSFGDAAH